VSAEGLEDRSLAASGEVAARSAAVEAQRVDLVEREQMSDFVQVRSEYPPTIPLSVLSLDIEEPTCGWAADLARRGISVTLDDLGRLSVSRADARRLFEEKRAAEQKAREVAQRNEREAIEADRAWRATLNKGLPWYALPDGVSYGQAVAEAEAAEAAEQPRRVPSRAEWLFGETDTMVYHELPHDEAVP
jgi:hypothetical protein